jgi:plastocyanin
MQLVRMAALGAALVILAAGALACGDDDDDDGGDDVQATATSGSGAPGSPTAAADEVTVTAADFSFSPSALTISKTSNTTITLNNTGDVPHTIDIYYDAGYTDALDDTGNVSPGASGEVTIDSHSIEAAAELFFRCNVHPDQMEGTIRVD